MKMMCLFWRTTVVGLAVMPLLASIPWPPRNGRPTHFIAGSGVKAAKPRAIDGVVDEGEWQGAVTGDQLHPVLTETRRAIALAPKHWFLYDAGHSTWRFELG